MFLDTDAYDEVLAVADGRAREDIETRANLAFDRANGCRAALSATPGTDFFIRAGAINRASAWVDVLRYLDRTGAVTFSREDFKAGPPGKAGGSDVRRYGLVRALALDYGHASFTFYKQSARTA